MLIVMTMIDDDEKRTWTRHWMARRRVGLPYPGDVQLMLHGCHMQHGCHISRDVCTAVREERSRYMTSPRNDGGASHDGRDRKARRDDGNGGSGAAPDHSVDSVPLGGGGVAGGSRYGPTPQVSLGVNLARPSLWMAWVYQFGS